MESLVNKFENAYNNIKSTKTILILFAIPLLLLIPFSIFAGSYKILAISVGIPLLVFMIFYFDKYFMYYFIATLFINFYFSGTLKIQVINLFSYALIFFFIINKDSSLFNNFRLPKDIKFTAAFLIFSVLISSIFSPYSSPKSLYYGYLFLTFITTSYVIYRTIIETKTIERYLDFYLIANSIAALIIIGQIFATSRIRSIGISGYSYMGLVMNSFLIIFFKYLILGKPNLKYIIIILIFTVTIVTNQSRFSWFGIVLSIIYGLLVCFKYEKEFVKFLKSKLFIVLFSIFAGIVIIISTGLSELLFLRVSEINFNFFESEKGEELVSNSLESRILIWSVAFNTFLHNPITGIGFQMFPEVSENYNFFPNILYVLFIKDLDAHSTMMNILCETGIIGFLSFFIYVFIIYKYSFKAITLSKSREDKNNSIVLNILMFLIVSSCIYSGAYTFAQNAFEMHFIFGVTFGNYLLIKNKSTSPSLV